MAVILAPAGCSFGGDDDPEPAVGAPRAIAATVDRLERSIAGGDYATVCEELFTAAARRRAGGEDCAAQLRSAGEGLRRPSIEVRGIEVKGERATATVATAAQGQARVRDELELRREDGRWLIEALGG